MGTNTNVCLTRHKGRMGRRGDRRVRPGGESQVRSGGKGSREGEKGEGSRADAHVGKSTDLVTLSSNKA